MDNKGPTIPKNSSGINKRKVIYYAIAAAMLILLVLIVSLCAIWIKYKVVELEAMIKTPNVRDYSIYYNSLNYKQQLLYDEITYSAEDISEESEILTYSYDMEEFQEILSCIRADRPDLFYVNFNQLVLYHSNNKTKVGMVYHDTKDNIESMQTEYEQAVETAMQQVLPSMTDFEKEVAINDYILDNCSYAIGDGSPLASTAYGALVNGQAFCDGYAYAAKELLDRSYIESCIVYGTANDAEHVWNMVQIDGNYYHLDVMWNDADLGFDCNIRFHGYFNMSDSEILKDHSFDNEKGILPEAKTGSNYYKQIDCYTESLENVEDIFVDALIAAAEKGNEYIELECLETKDNSVLSEHFSSALVKANELLGSEVFFQAFNVHPANVNTNAVTIQIFYN